MARYGDTRPPSDLNLHALGSDGSVLVSHPEHALSIVMTAEAALASLGPIRAAALDAIIQRQGPKPKL